MKLPTWKVPNKMAVLLTVALLLIITIAPGVKGLASSSTKILSFNTCSLPCVLGIIPGETDYSQAIRIIEKTVPQAQITWEGYFWIRDANGTRIEITVHRTDPRNGDYVKSIELLAYPEGQITSLGEILAAGYIPQRVFRNRINPPNTVNILIFFGADSSLIVGVTAIKAVNPNSPIEHLTVSAPQDQDWVLEDIRAIQHYDYEIDWLGYSLRESYLDA